MLTSFTPMRRWSVLALVAVLGLAVTLVVTSASSASSGQAVAAKKKCKKGKKSAEAAKKHKCRKKKARPPQTQTQPAVPAAPGPLVRATLTWTASDDVDLHAFDSSGNQAGYGESNEVENTIPSSTFSGDVQTAGSESFTDDIFVVGGSANREFGYVACLWDDDAQTDYTASFTGVTRDGTTVARSLAGTPSDGPDAYAITLPGGPGVPSNLNQVCLFPPM
jgi:hypothetical protein